ncbi:hypothetical protein LEP1GSC116_3207 [Leptospira interrogans serovar Icterohaemorrhagiae str. Verdun HP]|uniref:Uncharacterized protein n=2 Tax=Leptospira interrogans TaxID=173 RepID=M6RFM7_LEPIR|nr:hypothetical protein LEP1GSC067_3211 [Leptospira interrogans serovar Lora str. TE 1992]EMO03409.1 hypothetical protein LEP1GSC116_3207 [Leptospira interrogans serovar Icterohaemorrhagiae str. Verdun HP]
MNLLQKFILSSGNIQIVSLDTQAKLSILRDDRLAFGMGTKFRKFLGIHSKLQVQNVKKVVLQGELHSNALAAFCFCFIISDIKYDRLLILAIQSGLLQILFL